MRCNGFVLLRHLQISVFTIQPALFWELNNLCIWMSKSSENSFSSSEVDDMLMLLTQIFVLA